MTSSPNNREVAKYTYRVQWSEADQEHVGTVVEFPSLSWLASTPLEAMSGIVNLVAGVVAESAPESRCLTPIEAALESLKKQCAALGCRYEQVRLYEFHSPDRLYALYAELHMDPNTDVPGAPWLRMLWTVTTGWISAERIKQ